MDIKEFFKNLFNYNAKDTFKGLLKKKKKTYGNSPKAHHWITGLKNMVDIEI